MAILFEFYETPDPTGEQEVRYHARPVTMQTVSTDTIAAEIQEDSSLTKGDVKAVLVSLSRKIAYHLTNSERVHLEGIGYFQATLKHTRDIVPEKTRSQSVWFKSVAFRADQELKKQLIYAPTERSGFKWHSKKQTNEEVDRKVSDYLQKNNFITRRKLEEICNLRPSTAGRHINRLVNEGKIINTNTRRQPIYVKG